MTCEQAQILNETSQNWPLCRERLTQKFFFTLSEGMYLESNVGGYYGVVSPMTQRRNQWKSIPRGARQRLCAVYKTMAHYDAVMAFYRKVTSEHLAKMLLTKNEFFDLAQGAYVFTGTSGKTVLICVTESEEERLKQWKAIPFGARGQVCNIFLRIEDVSEPLRLSIEPGLAAALPADSDDVPF